MRGVEDSEDLDHPVDHLGSDCVGDSMPVKKVLTTFILSFLLLIINYYILDYGFFQSSLLTHIGAGEGW